MKQSFFKSCIDFSLAIVFIIVLFPVLVLIAFFLFIECGGKNVFFTQQRPGLNERPFQLIKFKTMNDKKDETGKLLPDEQRLTKTGNFLRKLSLDELPQLFNVLKGELSLVGPRPLLMQYLPLYDSLQAKRHLVKPGITGWAQVNGRNTIDWDQKLALDVWYVENWSLLLDIKILWKTLFKVIASDGVNTSDGKAMPLFTGSADNLKNTKQDDLDHTKN